MVKRTTLRKVRREQELTLDDLYVLTGRKLSQGRISRIDRGVFIPNSNDKKLLAKALKTPIYKLFPENQ
jgi:transcriptional regulator with XRE-family HTH domain